MSAPTKWRVSSTDGTARFKLPKPGEVLVVHSDGEHFWVTWVDNADEWLASVRHSSERKAS